ncbi:MAG: hypothetical protein P8Z80_19535 [Pseudolabrys sp.]
MIETLKPFGVGQYHNAIDLIALAVLLGGALFAAFSAAFLAALLAAFLAELLVFGLPLSDALLDCAFRLAASAMVSLPSAALLPKFVPKAVARSHKLRKRAAQNTEGVGETSCLSDALCHHPVPAAPWNVRTAQDHSTAHTGPYDATFATGCEGREVAKD